MLSADLVVNCCVHHANILEADKRHESNFAHARMPEYAKHPLERQPALGFVGSVSRPPHTSNPSIAS